MRPEDRLLFAVTRQDFLGEHREAVDILARGPMRWEEVAATAERHGVAPIAGANLKRCGLGEPVAGRFERALFENALIKAREAERLAEGIGRLREAGYQVMLLKGVALDLLVYREPWVVVSKDADLLLRPEPGRRLAEDERDVRRSLYRSGIECDVPRHHDVDMNGALPVRFDRIWEGARKIGFHGQEAFVMAPEDLLISLCVNSCRKRFFRLKSLFDVAESVRRLELDWGRLAGRAREDRCERIVYAALHATMETLGCEVPAGVLDALEVPRTRVLLIRRLVTRFLRRGSLESPPSPWLPYATYRWGQALRSLRVALTWEPPAHRRALGAPAGQA
ncbi:MAG TPA: nucleotidyltransferase family protein [Thermoanaerobaculia bacterium]|nr:nucleotidyltransferase family protein [Thermoanaerobaculia bacterium]